MELVFYVKVKIAQRSFIKLGLAFKVLQLVFEKENLKFFLLTSSFQGPKRRNCFIEVLLDSTTIFFSKKTRTLIYKCG
jgi:hypothetical protein